MLGRPLSIFMKLVISWSAIASSLAFADSVEVENKAYWLCKNSREVRTIRVAVSAAGICSTYYAKQGSEKAVGSGKNQESCIGYLNNIKGNLEKSNWSCRDVSATRITSSIEE
ncbi:MAG TPA: hypothetical protein PKC28_00060 [Bdellovibrionales bacterium]|nr:hypothetical protein [Bdellovibrionales bacterium]